MRVAILGCGYVGLELGRGLVANGHDVVGVRRSDAGVEAVVETGLDPVRADVTDPDALERVPDADAIVFAASAGGRDAAAARSTYVDGLETVVGSFGARDDPPDRLLYTSSTGVYGDHGGAWVDESTPVDPDTERRRALVDAERIALDRAREAGIDGTVARLAGLYGPGRYRLERYLEGPVTEGWLNLVHRDDAAGAVRFLLERDRARGEVVLVVDDEPVSKHALADWLAERCGVDPPPKQTLADRLAGDDLAHGARKRLAADKRCTNDRLRGMGYAFAYPTFREGYRPAIADHEPGV